MLSAFFIFNPRGDVLISKLFREGVKRNIADVFRIQVISNNEIRSPILTLGSTTFLHIQSNQLWFVAVTRSNVDASIVFESLYKVLQILKTSFTINENEVKLNFTLIYEILDQVYEFGYPQTTDLSTFQLTNEAVKSPTSNSNKLMGRRPTLLKRKPSSQTGSTLHSITSSTSPNKSSGIPWRNEGIKYKVHRINLDVSENVNLLVSANGTTLRSYVNGKIKLSTHLSGMPICKIRLDNANEMSYSSISLEDYQFHQCVDLKLYEKENVIQFIPPDGEFDLMTYRTSENVDLPFKIIPSLNITNNILEIQVAINSTFKKRQSATGLEFIIPVPNGVIKTDLQCSSGKLRFEPTLNSIVWKCKKFLGQTEINLNCSVEINNSSNILNWPKPPMMLKFDIKMYTCSRLSIRSFDFEDDSIKLLKGVNYISQAGSYEVRY